ncbi:hypothetical protein [Rhodovulum steppense]|uniref:Uncharacterized protein n=1 Tax=Rhodovulum steppense TaxID=540251 RepID=A0A4R1YSV8_9RHOB|nr:hypothetical protein [Rhodovulum steppense]TCM82723.1 hypothetical protein EV216_11587 [Rhodovulum steppense]
MTFTTCPGPLDGALPCPVATAAKAAKVNWRWTSLRVQVRNMLFAACLSLPATMILHAEEAPQGWLPEVVEMPADMEVITDRAIGSTIRMFSFSTGRDPDELLAEWEDALRTAGYTIQQAQGEILARSIEFSGQGIANAKMVVAPVVEGARSVIEVDATLQ